MPDRPPENREAVDSDKSRSLRPWIESDVSRLVRTVVQIFGDLVITLTILFSLQAVHVLLEMSSLPDWVKLTVSRIHDYSMIIVVALFAIEFVLRMAGRSLKVMTASLGEKTDSLD